MKNFLTTKTGQTAIAILSFLVIGCVYFYPVLFDFQMRLGDVDNAKGMSEFVQFYYLHTGELALWTPNSFLGMPSYMIFLPSDLAFLNSIPRLFFNQFGYGLGGFLVMCFGFYTLLRSFEIKNLLSIAGALFFAFSGYFIVVLSAGHFNKVYSIGAFPFLFAGFIQLTKNKGHLGYLTVAAGGYLAFHSNHPQISYYFAWILGLYLLYSLIEHYKTPAFIPLLKRYGFAVGIVLVALLATLETYYTTYSYSKHTIRGANDVELPNESSSPQDGLDLDYITQWSYGIEESWNLIVPAFKGGGSGAIGNRSETKMVTPRLKKNVEGSSLYWGNQPFTAGPAYMGIIVFLLFVFGMVYIKSKLKWIFLGCSVLALMLAWGKNFMPLTEFFVNYFPLYNKFRAVTMIHSIIGFCLPFVGIWFLHGLSSGKINVTPKSALITGGSIFGLLILFYLGNSSLFDFISIREQESFAQQAGQSQQMAQIIHQFTEELEQVRIAIFKNDIMRAMMFVAIAVGAIYLFLKKKISSTVLIVVVCFFGLFDLIQVDKRVLNTEKINGQYRHFEKEREKIQVTFEPSQMDQQILLNELNANPNLKREITALKLTDEERLSNSNKQQLLLKKQLHHLGLNTNYRVLNMAGNPFTDSRTSYYHKSVGGYHAAKLRKVQNLIDFHFGRNGFSPNILASLNVKYITTSSGLQVNPNNLGPAWVVKDVRVVQNQTEAIRAIGEVDLSETAVVPSQVNLNNLDTNRVISLSGIRPNKMEYRITPGKECFAVFSEMYYKNGWKAWIDGEETPILNVNYWMRGLHIPAGAQEIIFEFAPTDFQVVKTMGFLGNLGICLLIILFGFRHYQSKKNMTTSTAEN